MQVSVEKTSDLERRMTVELPADSFENSVRQKLQAMGRRHKIKGFRPGKAPMKVLENRFGAEARAEAYNEAIQSTLYQALDQEQLRPAGQPSIEPQLTGPGEAIRYVAVFEVYPEIEPAPVDAIELEKPVVEISDEDVDQVIETIRKQRMEWKPVDRSSKEGDQVNIDFKGFIDGEAFQGGEAQNVPLVLGSSSMIDTFEEQLTGVSANDEVSVKVTFPDEYHAAELAGKAAEFQVKVNSVSESELPELNDEFVKSMGVEDGKLETFRSEVRENMQRELDQKIKSTMKEQVMKALVAANDIEVPKSLVDNEANALLENMRNNFRAQGAQEDVQAKLDASMFQPQARERVVLGLLVGEIARKNNLEATEDKVRSQVEEVASTYQEPEQLINYYYSNPEQLRNIEFLVVEEMVVNWVADHAKIKEKKVSFNELMHPTAEAG